MISVNIPIEKVIETKLTPDQAISVIYSLDNLFLCDIKHDIQIDMDYMLFRVEKGKNYKFLQLTHYPTLKEVIEFFGRLTKTDQKVYNKFNERLV